MSSDEIPAAVTSLARILRVLAVAATICATIVMFTSNDTYTVPFSTNVIRVDYKDLMCFKAFVGVNIAATVYGMFVAALPVNSMLWKLVWVPDVIMCVLLASIDSVAMTAAYMHKNGDSQAYWPPICDRVPTYCDHVMGALIAGFAGAAIYLFITIYSISLILNPLLVQ